MPGPQQYARVQRFFDATAAATPADRARAVREVCALAERNSQTAAGIFSTGAMQTGVANSRGLFCSYTQTRAEFSVTVLENDSSGWAKANSPNVSALKPAELAARASQKASGSRNPRELPPGRYTVILEPPAVLHPVGFLFFDFSGTSPHHPRFWPPQRMGPPVVGENISLLDDVYHPFSHA